MKPDKDDISLEDIKEKLDEIEYIRRRELSFFGLVFLIVLTLTTNLWAQYVYHAFVTNDGMGSNDGASIMMLLLFTVISIAIITAYVLSVENVPN